MTDININGIEISVEDGTTILDAAAKIGIEIPTLCHLQGQAPLGACRVCVVEVEEGQNPYAGLCYTGYQGHDYKNKYKKSKGCEKACC